MSNKEVTDDEALRALLSSAEARDQERKEERNRNQKKRWGDRNNDRGGRGNGNRWGDSNNNRHGSNKRSRLDDSNARSRDRNDGNDNDNANYYGPASEQRGRDRDGRSRPEEGNSSNKDDVDGDKPPPTHKPNFGLSGALAKDEGGGGNVYKGVVLKFREPPEARAPNTQWRFYLFKGKDLVDTLHISRQSAYLMGRNTDICDIPMAHPSLSSQHAVLQYRALPTKDGSRLSCQPYIMDLESTNGTFLNGVRIDSARYYQLKKGDVLKFGASTREYVLMTENTTSVK